MNRRRVLVLFFAAALARCEKEVPWDRVSPAGGRFSVEMPKKPRLALQKANTEWGLLEVRFFEAETHDGAVVYSVTYTDYPIENMSKQRADSLLVLAQNATVKDVAGEVLDQDASTFQGYPARRTEIRGANGVEYKLLVVLANARLFQVLTASRVGKLTSRERQRFFDSFRIED